MHFLNSNLLPSYLQKYAFAPFHAVSILVSEDWSRSPAALPTQVDRQPNGNLHRLGISEHHMTSFSCRPSLPTTLDDASVPLTDELAPRIAEITRLHSDRAKQRVSALGEMTAGLAHDFRNILAIIQSGISVARRAAPQSPNAALAWAAIDDAIARGSRLTGELLVFARGGAPDVHPENINALLTASTTFMKYGAGPGIDLKLDLASALPACRIDRAQFNAAILNLVVNARDAMPEGGEIRISTDECSQPCGDLEAPAERWVRVRIADQGCGMSSDVVEHLFDPYFTTKGDAGTGLGVPQVVAFMRASGGTVCVSTEPGAGTCFDLCFPVGDHGDSADERSQCRQLDHVANDRRNSRSRRKRKCPGALKAGTRKREAGQAREAAILPDQIGQSEKLPAQRVAS
jgi:signal transduction histidine kinase